MAGQPAGLETKRSKSGQWTGPGLEPKQSQDPHGDADKNPKNTWTRQTETGWTRTGGRNKNWTDVAEGKARDGA